MLFVGGIAFVPIRLVFMDRRGTLVNLGGKFVKGGRFVNLG
jgi:hypothetical protein